MSEVEGQQEAPETQEAPAQKDPAGPRSEQDVVERYFPRSEPAPTRYENRDRNVSPEAVYDREVAEFAANAYVEGASDTEEMYGLNDDDSEDESEYESEPEADLGEMTLQDAYDAGYTDEDIQDWSRRDVRDKLQEWDEQLSYFAQQRAERSQAQQAQQQQQTAEGYEHLQRFVGQAHRKGGFGLLGQDRSVPLAAAHTEEAVQELVNRGWSVEQIAERSRDIIEWASKTAAEQTHMQNMLLRLSGRRTDTGERERG